MRHSPCLEATPSLEGKAKIKISYIYCCEIKILIYSKIQSVPTLPGEVIEEHVIFELC